MAYTKTEWKDHVVDTDTGTVIQYGTIISAENLNHIEQGISDLDTQLSEISGTINELLGPLDTRVTALETAVANIGTTVSQLLTPIQADITALKAWKESVMSGQEVLLIKNVPDQEGEDE